MPAVQNAAPPVTPRYAPLVIVLAATCAGIVMDRLWPIAAQFWWMAAFVMICVWLAARALGRDRSASWLLCLVFAALGGAWHQAWWHLYPREEIGGMIDSEPSPTVVEAIALYAPRRVPAPPRDPLKALQTEERSRLKVQITAVRDAQVWRPASGQALVLIDGHLQGVFSGDRLRIAGAISGPAPPLNPGDMDFEAYARAERRLAFLNVSFPDCVTVLERGSPWRWRRGLDAMRQRGDLLLWQHIAPERAGLAAALLLGAREQLDAERSAAFLRTNTIHILAISGMHVAILAASLFYALRLGITSRRTTLAAVVAATVLYTLLTDAPPSAVRAMILVLLVCLALFVGRPTAAFNCWAAGGLVVLALNPTDLFRAGPQLSFLCVAAMVWMAPISIRWRQLDALQRLILQTRPWPIRALRAFGRSLARATWVTTVIWLATMPLIATRFHCVSPAVIVLTTLLLVPVSVALMSGFATMLLGFIAPPLGRVCGAVCDFSLWIIDESVVAASRMPASYFWISGPSEWWLTGFYLGVALRVVMPQLRWRRFAQLAGVWVAIGLMTSRADRGPDRLECTFVSVGHGMSVILRTPEGQAILYDAGRLSSPSGGARSVGGTLWAAGIMRLDAVVISHADIDHYNALPELLEQFSVDTVYVSPLMFREDVEPLRLLREAIQASGAALVQLSAGDRLVFGDSTVMTALHPPPAGVPGNDNAQSIVLAVEYQGRRILLPGDLESPGTQALLAQPAWDCDVLLAPHHGSTRSNPPGFSAWSRPEWVVISGSYSNDKSGAIARSYQAVGARVFHTARDGAVRFVLSAEGIDAARWQKGAWEPCGP